MVQFIFEKKYIQKTNSVWVVFISSNVNQRLPVTTAEQKEGFFTSRKPRFEIGGFFKTTTKGSLKMKYMGQFSHQSISCRHPFFSCSPSALDFPGQQFSPHSLCVCGCFQTTSWRRVCWSPTCATSCVIKSSSSTQPCLFHSRRE